MKTETRRLVQRHRHAPVRAGGSPDEHVKYAIICGACMARWPCPSYLQSRAAKRLQR